MASSRPATSTSSSSSATIVHQLAALFRTNGHRVTHGDSKVCFTSDSLTLLNNYFQSAKIDISTPVINGGSRTNSLPSLPPLPPVQHLRINTKLKDDLVFLHDFLKKIQFLKLIQNSPTLQGNVLLHPFDQVICLEIKKIPPHMVLGLSTLRHKLETLICTQSVTKIADLISDCGGDLVQPQAWPKLKSLFLDHNYIERIDQSLRYLTVLEVLDLSHNRLQDCSHILDIIPHVKHLNLSSNHLRSLPIWSHDKGPCRLLTLKMRQNSLENLKGIETMTSLEELDLSDNFITQIPEEIRQLTNLKRVLFARNPFTYDSNYRQQIIVNLPFVFSQETRELLIDNQPLTLKEKQKITRTRNPSTHSSRRFTPYSSSSPSTTATTTSESTTEPESHATASTGTVVSRRRSRRKQRDGRLRTTLDSDETPHASSGSDDESTKRKPRLAKLVESRHENDNNNYSSLQSPPTTTIRNVYSPEQDDNSSKSSISPSIASSIPRKLANDITESPKRRKSPRSRKSELPTKLVLEVVDVSNTVSDDTPVPDSPVSEKNLSLSMNHQTPMPILEPKLNINDEQIIGDSIQTIFFVTDQTTNDNNRSLTIEIDPMYLIEKDINNEDYLEKIKYSIITLINDEHNNQKFVEFTFEKKRNDIERRIYLFDTIQDKQAFIEEIERHLEIPTIIELKPESPVFVECTKCGKTFPPLATMNNLANGLSPICLSCQNSTLITPPAEAISTLQLNTTVDISSDEIDLDHRLHFQVATDHFTHNNEKIKLHFKCFVVHSTTSKYFIGQTILTDYGIYIFQCETLDKDKETEYILVGKDLLTNVLMLDIGYRLQTFTIELQSAAFAFLLADQNKTQKIVNHILEVLSPIVESGEGALQKISRISSDEYRQRLFDIIKSECNIDEPTDDMIDFYSIIIRMDQAGHSQMIALLLLQNWILMIEDSYVTIDSRHVRLPAPSTGEWNHQLKCDLMHLVNVINYNNHPKLFVFHFVDESETKQFRWKLESLSNESKEEFLTKVRHSYKTFMGIDMPETIEKI